MRYTISSANLSLLKPGEGGKILPPPHTKEYQELGIAPDSHLVVLKRHPVLLVAIDRHKIVVPSHLSKTIRVFDNRSRYPPQSTATITSEALITA